MPQKSKKMQKLQTLKSPNRMWQWRATRLKDAQAPLSAK
jgi:hypothetical protein